MLNVQAEISSVSSKDYYKQGITIAYRLDSAPMQFQNKNGQADGVLIDFWRLWSIKTGIPVTFIGAYNKEAQQLVLRGHADLNAGLFENNQRASVFDFSNPIISSSYYIYYQKNLKLNSVKDFESLSLGVTRGSFHENFLREHYPQLKLVLFDGYQAMFKAAESGRIQGFVTQENYLKYFLLSNAKNENSYRHLDKPLYARQYRAAVKKGNSRLLTIINQSMSRINKADQRVIVQYWLGKLAAKVVDKNTNNSRISLTREEKLWLKAHPVIEIGVDGNWPPVDFVDANGRHSGIAHDFLNKISEILAVTFKPVAGPTFHAMLQKVATGQLKAGMTIVKTPARQKNLWFTEPYFTTHKIIVSRRASTQYRTINDLQGKIVTMEKGYYSVDLIKHKYPEIKLKLMSSTLDALKEVSWGRADAYIGNGAVVEWLINEHQIVNLNISGDAGLKPSAQRFVVYKDKQWRPLVGILNKALAGINLEQRQKISHKWINFTSDVSPISSRIKLTEAQRQWLKQHPDIRLGIDIAWPPIEFVDHKGHYQGLSSDFIKRFSQALGVNTVVDTKLSWAQVIEQVKNKQLDILPAVVKTPNREQFLTFTQPYLNFSIVIFVNDQNLHTTTLQDLHGKRVGIEKSYVTQEYLQRDHPEIELVFVKNNKTGLELVAQGKIDAYIGNLTSSSYLISKYGIANVKVGGVTPYASELRMGVRKDWPELRDILNSFLNAMTEEEIAQIRHQWLTVKYDVEVDYSTIRNTIIIAAILVMASFLWIFYTRQKNARLKQSEEQLNRIINAIPLAIMLTDDDGIIVRANPYVSAMVHSQDSVAGRNVADFFDDRKQQNMVFHKLQKEGGINNFQVHFRTDTNEVMTGLLSAIIINMGSKKYNLGIFVDLTERIKIEDQLKQAKEASEQASRFKTSFLANMSHEIRTPMNAIIGMTHLALMTELTDKQLDYINKIDVSAHNLLAIINDILDISKIEAGKLTIEKTTFNLDELLQHLSDLLALKAAEKNLRIIFQKDPQIPAELMGDPLRLGQILLNLVQNAIKFTQQGQVRVKVELIHQSSHHVQLHFSVADTGIGIDKEKISQLFNPFVQADSSISREYGGTGLGLSISQQLVFLMGGELSAESLPGKGSTFAFKLEFEKQQTVGSNNYALETKSYSSINAQKLPVQRLKGKVLLVEDNKINQQVARELLESFGLLVVIADNGQEAVVQVQQTNFDLILMDIQMPVMDGIKATQILRKDEHFKLIPIIAMTAHAMDGDKEACLKAGMNDYLSKPIDPDDLLELLSNWLDSYEVSGAESGSALQQDINLPEEIPGIDLSWGLKRVGGNKKLFIRLLNDFYNTHNNVCEKTRQYLTNNNIEAARREVHTIQGVAGNIGAKQLQFIANKLESAIRMGEQDINDYLKLSESFCQQVKIVFDALNEFNQIAQATQTVTDLKSQRLTENKAVTQEVNQKLIRLTNELHNLLLNGDCEAQNVVQEIMTLLNQYSYHHELQIFQQIESLVQNYDYEAAEELLPLLNFKNNTGM